jgi:hypothetical protein
MQFQPRNFYINLHAAFVYVVRLQRQYGIALAKSTANDTGYRTELKQEKNISLSGNPYSIFDSKRETSAKIQHQRGRSTNVNKELKLRYAFSTAQNLHNLS